MPQRPDILAVSALSPLLMEQLTPHFEVHQRLHETDPAALARLAPKIRAIVGGGESTIARALMAQLPALEFISIMGVGYDKVDVQATLDLRVPVTHTPGVLNDEVADLAIALMLAVSRRIAEADRYVRAGRWAADGAMPLGRKVSGARLGIVGLGGIGQDIARRALAFGMAISYTARSARPDSPYRFYPTPTALAAEVDFLVVITPGGEGTRHLIDAQVLAALGSKGYLVNVSRGSVVDEAALVEALQKGIIAGAALDVFVKEPHPSSALMSMDNVVLTPHIGSGTRDTRQAMADLAFRNLQAHFAGDALISPVPEWRS